MPGYKFVVLINAVTSREEEFNHWFDSVHIPDAMMIPGFSSAQRFRLTEQQLGGALRQWNYMALYDIRTNDLGSVVSELKSRLNTPLMRGTDTLASGAFLHFYEPIAGPVFDQTPGEIT